MKKTKIFALLVIIMALIISVVCVSSSAAVTSSSFIAAPEKTLVQGVDYEYSFAVLGDTQCISLADVKNGTAYTEQMFNWIKNNKESKNIQYVLGLGDITNTYKSSDTYYTAEWQLAKNCYAILDEAGISYSLVRGNHDISSGMNGAFGMGTEYYNSIIALSQTVDSNGNAMGGFLEEYTNASNTSYKIENSYRKITVGEDKWLIVTLDWAPSEAALTWLANILDKNSDYRAIITLHQFVQKDGAIIDDPEGTLPHENIGDANWNEVATGGTVHPRVLWDEVLSKYANVEMILSGHVPVDDIVRTQYRGDNGNTVTCMLIDPQEMDEVLSAPVGMVAMFYFSADGNVVNVEYISAVRDSDNDDSTDAYRGAKNQFSMQLEYADGWVKTEYGYAPKTDYDNSTFLAFLDDDGDESTESVYLGAYERWVDDAGTDGLAPMIRTQFTLGGAAIRQKKVLSVLTLKDYDAKNDGKYQLLGEVCGTLKFDLGGKTFTNGSYPIFAAYTRTSYTTNTFELINGNVVINGSGGLVALQTTNDKGNNGTISVNLEDLNVSYGESGKAAAPIVTTYPGNQAYNSTSNVTVTNCNIDAYNNAPTSVTLFNLADTYANHDASVTFAGGSISMASESAVSVYKLASGDSFAFAASELGYTKLLLPTDAPAPTQMYKNAAGTSLAACEKSRDDNFVTYELEEYSIPAGSLGVINVWLIGGQSNASGYAIDTPTDALTDSRFTEGFDNVLYYGSADDNVISSFVPAKIGQGKSQTAIGAEIGIASMLGGNGTMNAIIKLGRGASYLYPDTGNDVSKNYGTWTSPSYISNNGVNTDGTKIGNLYAEFIQMVKDGLELLEAQGYTPVIRGMWWMQGEAETWREALALEYENLISAFIGDVRSDLSDISGENLSNMPFIIGVVDSNQSKDESGNFVYTIPPYIEKVAEAQRSIAAKAVNVSYIETKDLERRDQWHFTADVQQYLGEQFVNKVVSFEGKYSVTVNGVSVSVIGGGAYEAGTEVTVTIVAENGFVIEKVTYTVGTGEPTEITLDENNSYTFTMPEDNVAFTVTTFDPNMIDTVYGSIPSQYADTEKWPFAVFKNGSFYSAYATWNDVLRSGTSILTSETTKATLLLRRDYSTSEDDASLQDLYTFEGELTIDLANHTLTRGQYHLFQVMAKKTTAKKLSTTIKVINGSIETQGSTPIVINTRQDALNDHFYFEFDGVTFKYATSSTVANMIMVTYTNGTADTEVTALFKNCIFDLTNAPSCTIFNLKEDSGSEKSAYLTIENSEFIANNLTGISLYSALENDSFILGEGVTFKLPSNYDTSSFAYSDTTGKTYTLKLYEAVESESIYTLEEGEAKPDYEETPYGNIPSQYTNTTTYPFVVFDQNKEFIGAYEKWDTFLASGSKILTSSNQKAFLLVRRDYNTSENSSSSQNWYTFSGSIEIDLGGYSLTINKKSHLFQLINKCTTETETNITISNGNLVTYLSYTPFVINGHANSTANYTVNLTCNNVKFIYHKSSTLAKLVLDTFATGTTESNLYATFNDCTFDLSNATKAVTIFNAKESGGTEKASVIQINGGNIIANVFTQASFYQLASGDSVSFGKGANGNYISLTMLGTAKVPAPSYYYSIDGNDAYFHENKSSETETVYTLSICSAAEGSHNCSCGKVMSTCIDEDKDHLCNVCGTKISECTNDNSDHTCDLCGAILSECTDENNDHACDICEEKTECTDENSDHACDICGEKTVCADENSDHTCDICGEKTECSDDNLDHKCDVCGNQLSECNDENNDHYCDICEIKITECTDENCDHKCDICEITVSECRDDNKDHTCDICTANFGECNDSDYDHLCDYGCGKKFGNCEDKNLDHKCDYGCDKVLGEHVDVNLDHFCDYGCNDVIGACEDKNLDHKCDYGCDKIQGEHIDINLDHVCDYGCNDVIGVCEDKNLDHMCDYGCHKIHGAHVDANYDHICDYGCNDVIGVCEDKNLDHKCDYGCDRIQGEHIDINLDHACDYGCNEKDFGDCEDADKDHVCDYGCGKTHGKHTDASKDHVCDYGCGNSLGNHADSPTDKDHVCDYGCTAILEDCTDNDNNHCCDVCKKQINDCIDENNDHVCDLCKEKLTDCNDENKDHKCDICTKVLADCTDENGDCKCDVCGKEQIKSDVNNDTNVTPDSTENKEEPKSFIEKIIEFFKNLFEKIAVSLGIKKED